MSRLLLTGFATVVTNDRSRGGLLGVIRSGALAMEDDVVAWVGAEADVPAEWREADEHRYQNATLLPGFVDSHTHLVFAGHRAEEFARRAEGARYEEILAAGGGIHSTVRQTRAAAPSELEAQARRRLERMLASGTTTVEIKSGYGLSVEAERTLLRVARVLDDNLPIDVVPTFLGAHAVPPDTSRAEYVELVIEEMLPACAGLAEFCDVFCDEGAFTVDEARRILQAGKEHGLEPRLHAEQLAHTGAAVLAAEMGAASADHLDHVDRAGVQALAGAGVAAVLLPGVSFSLRSDRPPPARALWEAGAVVALATDCNPGTSYVQTMPWVIAAAVREMGLTPGEAVWAATRGGALALRMEDRGELVPGAAGDLVVLDADSHLHLAYRPDGDLVDAVYKSGVRVV